MVVCDVCASATTIDPGSLPTTCAMAASRDAGQASTSKPATLRDEAAASNAEVYDKLIDVFQQRQPSEWRKLIAYSKQFPKLAEGVLARCVHDCIM